jgi:hypothetical protein
MLPLRTNTTLIIDPYIHRREGVNPAVKRMELVLSAEKTRAILDNQKNTAVAHGRFSTVALSPCRNPQRQKAMVLTLNDNGVPVVVVARFAHDTFIVETARSARTSFFVLSREPHSACARNSLLLGVFFCSFRFSP